MNKDFYWWSAIVITIIILLSIIIIDGVNQTKLITDCASGRIRPFVKEFFYWEGLQELGKKGLFQPRCL